METLIFCPHSQTRSNKVSVPPQNLLMPPTYAIQAYPDAGPGTNSVALTSTQGQTSKKAHKILLSALALKLQWLLTTGYSFI